MADAKVEIVGMAFTPPCVEVCVGDTVRWTNCDDVDHSIVFDLPLAKAPAVIPPSGSWEWTFSDAGTFGYHCGLMPDMKGEVVVS